MGVLDRILGWLVRTIGARVIAWLLRCIGKDGVVLKTRRDCQDIHLSIKKARHDLFISGINLNTLSGVIGDIHERRDLNVRLLMLDLTDAELRRAYNAMKGREITDSSDADSFLKHSLSCGHIEVKVASSIMPVLFVAYDIDRPDGYIKAEHLFNNDRHVNYPSIELHPRNEWYHRYKAQIEGVWLRAKPYVPKE